jgi:hypothetical protein
MSVFCESEYSNSKIRVGSDGPQKAKYNFLLNSSNEFDYISIIYGDSNPTQ